MKLIFIYGPPASGKLTIGEKISELTGIPLFHNHLSRDIVKDIYGDRLVEHYDLVNKIRVDVLRHCAVHNTDVIFTFVYDGAQDDEMVKSYIDCVKTNGGDVVFVELTATQKDLIERVGNESRKRFWKLTDESHLRELTKDLNRFSIPFVESIKINTSSLTALESAEEIIRTFRLL